VKLKRSKKLFTKKNRGQAKYVLGTVAVKSLKKTNKCLIRKNRMCIIVVHASIKEAVAG
jgi:hypothetical protein